MSALRLTLSGMSDAADDDDAGLDNGAAVAEDAAERSPAADSEFDEFLAMPDSLSVISIAGAPVLVEDKTQPDGSTGTPVRLVPFSMVHEAPQRFGSYQRGVFIPGEPVLVDIVHSERSATTHLLNPNLYTVRFVHGDFTWTVRKRYKHIQFLHQQLRLFRASLNIPFPSKTHRERRSSFKTGLGPAGKGNGALPRFPSRPDALVPYEQLEARTRQLEEYLRSLLSVPAYRDHPETASFMEVSFLSFVHELGPKGKEGMVDKRTGSTQPGQTGCTCCGMLHGSACVRCNYLCSDVLCGRWRRRWLFIKDTFLGYVHPKDGRVRCVMLFDQGFEVSSAMHTAGLHHGLHIRTATRQLTIRCWTRRKSREWMQHLKDVALTEAKHFTQPNRYGSYAPERPDVLAGWFVDGAGYMAAVADALEAATQEIFIADWWLSPEIHMKRPALHGERWRLDRILQRKAAQGVRVFVLLYKEVEMALGINSFYSKAALVAGCPERIKVLRHPDHAKAGVFLWAHHEKLVVVDQCCAFLGGIDLCYGRWDDHRHRLTDLGSLQLAAGAAARKKTSSAPTDATAHPVCELPVHPPPPPPPPVSERAKCNTPEFERRPTVFDRMCDNVRMLVHPAREPDDADAAQSDRQPDRQPDVQRADDPHMHELDGSAKLWLGKDYTNFIVKDFSELDAPYVDLVDRATTPRMPWHDVGAVVLGAAARDAARHFIQRWNATKLEKARRNAAYPYLVPKSYAAGAAAAQAPLLRALRDTALPPLHEVSCQLLRSASCWSCGFLEPDAVEQSIHEAYLDVINSAEHYLYVENQFFITQAGGGDGAVRNLVGDALCRRVVRAHRERATFRVYVVMPLLPGFEGEVGAASGTALHAVTHWNYASIARGRGALLARLRDAGVPDAARYVTFCGLRRHALLAREPVTELVYVHSKLLIADDRVVVCGSANINDRSLLGKRDSELAVVLRDRHLEPGRMAGRAWPAGRLAGSLRRRLFREHLGLLSDAGEPRDADAGVDVSDPVCDEFYEGVWRATAALNTELYEKVFRCIPSDQVDSFAALRRYQQQPPLHHSDPAKASIMLETIRGHLVLLPLDFLCNEVLTPAGASVEGFMPTSLWT